MKRLIIYLIIFIAFVMTACTTPNSTNYTEMISKIQHKNIVDKRIEYWNIEEAFEGGATIIRGETVNEVAYNELKQFALENELKFEAQLLPADEFKGKQWAIVTLSVCNIRADGRHSAELLTQALMGTPVKVYQKSGSWYLIQTPDRYFGWVDEAAIALKTNNDVSVWKRLKKVLYSRQNGFAYSEASPGGDIECDLVLANLLSIVDETEKYYSIVLADGRAAYVKKEECCSLEKWTNKHFKIDDILKTAAKFKGVPYLWGGTSAKMVDCSGFTKSTYYMHGIILQRDASQQTLYGELVNTNDDYTALKAGDLVFFGKKASGEQKEKVTHVGLCIGNQDFIHASGKVRINSLDKTDASYTQYYETAFVRARRIADNVDGKGIEWIVDNQFYKEILP